MKNWVDSELIDQYQKLLSDWKGTLHRQGMEITKMPLPLSVILASRGQAAVEEPTVVDTTAATEVDFYELLGVDPDATMPDIKAAYRSPP